ncbi:hypothetical protein ADK75_28890 [Streptomyces virginiae]|uniref:Integral membrane protein n=1 Tax=Streptomyces virginiae TaxID=1961 RepID=A0A0L8M6D9_STRVG|nr:hypothetical protein ADK75_28890 [Streptomyces virginiae]
MITYLVVGGLSSYFEYEIHEVITDLVGVVLIGWSFLSSVRRHRRPAAAEAKGTGSDEKTEAPSGV